MSASLQLKLLGDVQIIWSDEPLNITEQKAIALLCYLAAHDKAVKRDEVVELLWGVRRYTNLRQMLYSIRRLAGADVWFDSDKELSLNADSDVALFKQAIKENNLERAIELYQGPFLDGFRVKNAASFQDWKNLESNRLQSLYMQCLSTQANLLEQEGAEDEALKLLRSLIDLDALNETTHRRIMMLEWQAGRIKDALEQFEFCRRTLAEELGLEPVSSTVQLFESIQSQVGTSIQNVFKVDKTTKSPTDFIGRTHELEDLAELFIKGRLVSLIGTGGVGKTSLAQTFIQQANKEAIFVSLSALRNTQFIPAAIANALNISFKGSLDPINQLMIALEDRQLLLVLDNLEQLLDAHLIIEKLLENTKHLQVLVTSRRTLGLEEEQTLYLQGLDFPRDDTKMAANTDAVRFFVKSVHAIDKTFALTEDNQTAVFDMCRLLQGLPLGLELAAGWLRFYDCQSLAELLEQNTLELENPGLDLAERHTSLRYVMEQSWTFLNEIEKSTLASLAVCRGGFSLEAARAVAGADIKILSSLRHQALLSIDSEGRYSRHPLVYSFSYEKLQTSSYMEQVSVHHARYYLKLLSEQRKNILGEAPRQALDLIEQEFENIHIAWLYAATANWNDALLTASDTLSLYADMRVRFHDAIELFDEAAKQLQDKPNSQITRALILADKGSHLNRLNRHQEALDMVNEVIQSIDDNDISTLDRLYRLKARSLQGLADYVSAKALLEKILEFSKQHYPEQLSRDYRAIANAEVCLGDYSSSEDNYRKAIELDKQNGYIVGLAINLNNLSELLILEKRYPEAEQMIEESLSYVEGVDLHLVPYLNLNKAQLHFQQNDLVLAKQFAELCHEEAKTYVQINLQSRSAALLANIAYLENYIGVANRHIQKAIHLANDNEALASLMHAFIILSLFSKNEAKKLRYLQAVIQHPATEYSDKQKAQELLNACDCHTRKVVAGQPLNIDNLVANLVANVLRSEHLVVERVLS